MSGQNPVGGLPYRVATLFGIGLLPKTPGTFGALVAIPMSWGLHVAGGFPLLAAATLLVTGLGLWSVGRIVGSGHDDPSEIVIDELAGMMVALWPLSYLMGQTGNPQGFPWPGVVVGFLLFRFFDIVKPPPVNWAERPGGALGVMLDDLVAGALAAALGILAAGVAHGWF